MIGATLFLIFIVLMLAGVPIGVSLGIGGMVAIALANSDTQLFGLFAAPQNFYAGIAKYPLLALPMFVLVGSIFDRSGVAQRMVTFAIAVVGRGPPPVRISGTVLRAWYSAWQDRRRRRRRRRNLGISAGSAHPGIAPLDSDRRQTRAARTAR